MMRARWLLLPLLGLIWSSLALLPLADAANGKKCNTNHCSDSENRCIDDVAGGSRKLTYFPRKKCGNGGKNDHCVNDQSKKCFEEQIYEGKKCPMNQAIGSPTVNNIDCCE
jgi:hypothetical protein